MDVCLSHEGIGTAKHSTERSSTTGFVIQINQKMQKETECHTQSVDWSKWNCPINRRQR